MHIYDLITSPLITQLSTYFFTLSTNSMHYLSLHDLFMLTTRFTLNDHTLAYIQKRRQKTNTQLTQEVFHSHKHKLKIDRIDLSSPLLS